MKYTKFITAMCIIFVLTLLCVSVNATPIDTPKLDVSSTQVEVTGQISGAVAYTNVTLEVFYPGKSHADLTYTKQNMLDTLATYGQGFTDKDGKYKFIFNIKGNAGDYLVRVSTIDTATPYELTFFFATLQNRVDAVTQIKDAITNKDSLKAIIDIKNPNSIIVKTLGLTNPLLATLDEDNVIRNIMSLSVETAIDPTKPSEFTDKVSQAIIIEALNESKISDAYAYREILKLSSDFISTYESKIPTSFKSVVSQNMSNKNLTTLAGTDSAFGENIILTAIKNGENWAVVDYIVKNHTTFLELSLTDYNALVSPEKVDVALLGRSYATKTAFKDDFLSEVAKQKQAEVVISRPESKGSSGGSSYVLKGEITPLPLQELPKEIENKFDDIGDVAWAKESIDALAEKGVLNGKGEKTFDPNGEVKREEFIKMIVIAFGFEDKASTATFDDMTNNDWFYPYVASGVKAKITDGNGDGKFGVGNSITRQDMATLLLRVAKLKNIKTDSNLANKFTDHDLFASYSIEGIYSMKNLGIIDGAGNNKFVPTDVCTRAQSAKVIYGLLKIIEKGGAVK